MSTNLNLNTVWGDAKSLFSSPHKTGPLSMTILILFGCLQYWFPLSDTICPKGSCGGSIWVHQPILMISLVCGTLLEFLGIRVTVPNRRTIHFLKHFVVFICIVCGLCILYLVYQVYVSNNQALTDLANRKNINWTLLLAYTASMFLTVFYTANDKYQQHVVKFFEQNKIDLAFISIALQSTEPLKTENFMYQNSGAFHAVAGIPYKVWTELINRRKQSSFSKNELTDAELFVELFNYYFSRGFGKVHSCTIAHAKLQQAKAIVSVISEIVVNNSIFD